MRRLRLFDEGLELPCQGFFKNLEKTVVAALTDVRPRRDKEPWVAWREKSSASSQVPRFEDLNDIDWGDTTGLKEALPSIEATISSAREKVCALTRYQKLLGSFYFAGLNTRVNTISKPHELTYGWIFDEQTPDGSVQIPFSRWLEEGDGHFWIRGKAGSGKSTLMKFIAKNSETYRCLKVWSNGKPLVAASFFFWNTGTELQKSQEGLLRSLLFEILRQNRELVPYVYDNLTDQRKSSLSCDISEKHSLTYRDDTWNYEELMAIYKALMEREIPAKFFFLIDGLDEYETYGNGTYRDLIDILKGLMVTQNVKICLSSRPLTQFLDAFSRSPNASLKLEDLTSPDIQHYASAKFRGHEQYHKLQELDPNYGVFIEDVVRKAQGVFLWVVLVVRDLLEGLTYNDTIGTLRERLEGLPEDLDRFFKHIFESIPRIYKEQTARTFRLALSNNYPVSLMMYASLDDVGENCDLSRQQHKLFSVSDVATKKDIMQRRLDGRTKGLLEVHRSAGSHPFFQYKVDFLHRTVRDFLYRNPDGRYFLSQDIGSQHQSCMLICHAAVLTLKRTPVEEDGSRMFGLQNALDELFYFGSRVLEDPENISTFNELLNECLGCLRRDFRHSPEMRDRARSHGLLVGTEESVSGSINY